MDIKDRNEYLAEKWRAALTQDEREDFNTRARTTQIISRAEVIKRARRKIKLEVKFFLKDKFDFFSFFYDLTCNGNICNNL